jgi:hypothetical protein
VIGLRRSNRSSIRFGARHNGSQQFKHDASTTVDG